MAKYYFLITLFIYSCKEQTWHRQLTIVIFSNNDWQPWDNCRHLTTGYTPTKILPNSFHLLSFFPFFPWQLNPIGKCSLLRNHVNSEKYFWQQMSLWNLDFRKPSLLTLTSFLKDNKSLSNKINYIPMNRNIHIENTLCDFSPQCITSI